MTALLSIGELATQTGLPVRTIRFYSDAGVVPEAERSEAGYRLYGPDALARLGLVRTLRDLGVDLPTIRRVLEREITVADVAAAHAAAIDAQIRVLRVQKAVLGAVARRGSDPKEMQRMHKLAQLSDDERKRIVADFLEEAFDGLDMEPGFAARMRSATPDAARRSGARAGRRLDRTRRARPGPGVQGVDPAHVRAALRGPRRRRVDAAGAGLAGRGGASWPSGRARARGRHRPDARPRRRAIVDEILPAFGARRDRAALADTLRDRHRRPRRALLAAAGDHQRLAADADHRPRVGVADRGPARVMTR